VVYAFTSVGSFTVTLNVNDGDGGTDSATFIATVLRFWYDLAGNMVFGGENNGADRVTFSRNRAGDVVATHSASGVTERHTLTPPSASSKVIAYGQGQNDHFSVSGVFPFEVEFYGGAGNDYLAGGANDDLLDGGSGNDAMIGGTGHDVLLGQAGNDKMDGGAGDDQMYGGDDNDSMTGNTGNDLLFGGNGVDTLAGVAGNDLLVGGLGNDRLGGGVGHDVLIGDGGADALNGESGDDLLLAGSLTVDLTGGGTTTGSTAPGDAYAQVLAEVLADWGAGGIAARSALQTTPTITALGSTLLDLGHIVSLDNAIDTLNGGTGADWLVYTILGATKDKVTLGAGDIGDIDFS
jgi:Ca2+-binding RTX toxin-like protein